MRARRLLDSCILATTVATRGPVTLTNAMVPAAWIAPLGSRDMLRMIDAVRPKPTAVAP